MITQAKHTPGRLSVEIDPRDRTMQSRLLRGQDGSHVAYCDRPIVDAAPLNQANAARLAHCWNNHDALLEALQAALPQIERFHFTDPNGETAVNPVLPMARAAIQAATNP